MQPSEIAEFLKSVDDMIAATSSGKLTWEKANPTTYVYDPPVKQGKIILQKVVQAGSASINFQVIRGGNNPVLEVHGWESRDISGKLSALYSAIEKSRDIKGLSLLKEILP